MAQIRWQEIEAIWKDNRWLYMIAGIFLGILSTPAIEQITGDLNTLIGNLVPETIGIIFTVLIINRTAENRAQDGIKQQLLAELRSPSINPAVNALERLHREDMLDDDYFIGKKLQRVNWESGYVGEKNFEGADFEGANFRSITSMKGSIFETVSFERARLMDANLESSFLFGANLKEADLTSANLKGAKLVTANLKGADLRHANLEETDLSRADLKEANLSYAKLKCANLSYANLKDANLWNTNLEGSFLFGTNLKDANLGVANLTGADLSGINLTSADLFGANLKEADLTSANLTGADLSGINLTGAKLSYAKLETTTLPDNTQWASDEDMKRFTNPDHPEYQATFHKINSLRLEQGLLAFTS